MSCGPCPPLARAAVAAPGAAPVPGPAHRRTLPAPSATLARASARPRLPVPSARPLAYSGLPDIHSAPCKGAAPRVPPVPLVGRRSTPVARCSGGQARPSPGGPAPGGAAHKRAATCNSQLGAPSRCAGGVAGGVCESGALGWQRSACTRDMHADAGPVACSGTMRRRVLRRGRAPCAPCVPPCRARPREGAARAGARAHALRRARQATSQWRPGGGKWVNGTMWPLNSALMSQRACVHHRSAAAARSPVGRGRAPRTGPSRPAGGSSRCQ